MVFWNLFNFVERKSDLNSIAVSQTPSLTSIFLQNKTVDAMTTYLNITFHFKHFMPF